MFILYVYFLVVFVLVSLKSNQDSHFKRTRCIFGNNWFLDLRLEVFFNLIYSC